MVQNCGTHYYGHTKYNKREVCVYQRNLYIYRRLQSSSSIFWCHVDTLEGVVEVSCQHRNSRIILWSVIWTHHLSCHAYDSDPRLSVPQLQLPYYSFFRMNLEMRCIQTKVFKIRTMELGIRSWLLWLLSYMSPLLNLYAVLKVSITPEEIQIY